MKEVLARLFAIDLRGLAALRIGVAILGLVDLSVRAGSLAAHYTDAGTMPRVDLLDWFAPWHEHPLCVHLLGGSTWVVASLFAFHFAALLALLVGWKSRPAAFVCWLFFASLVSRNPFLSYGGDVWLRLLLFWCFLVPIGGAWSIDRFVADRDAGVDDGGRTHAHASLGTAGLLVQVALVLFFAGVPKAGTEQWASGVGIAFALDQEESTRALGWMLRGREDLLRVLDYAVLAIEVASPFALFAPFAPLRVAAILAVWGMLAGILATMWVGIFPWLMAVSVLAFAPACAWDRLAVLASGFGSEDLRRRARRALEGLADGLSRLAPASPPLPRRLPSSSAAVRALPVLAREGVATLATVYALLWNVGLWRDAAYEAPRAIAWFGYVAQFRQSWGMFGEFSRTGWFTVPGRLADGRAVELAAAGGPLPTLEEATARPVTNARPAFVPDTFRDVHWFAMFRIMRQYPDQDGHFLYYGRYLCREWNRLHVDGQQLRGFEILYHHRPVGGALDRMPSDADYTHETLWRHDCLG